jgi:Neuraminidase (sialidase)
MKHQPPRIQFQTVGQAKKGTSRIQWSDDHGATWHEPQDATIEVAQAWQQIAARQGGAK